MQYKKTARRQWDKERIQKTMKYEASRLGRLGEALHDSSEIVALLSDADKQHLKQPVHREPVAPASLSD